MKRFLYVASIAVVAGCVDAATASSPIDGHYLLTSINGASMPASSDGCGAPVTSGTLDVVQQRVTRKIVYGGGAPEIELHGTVAVYKDIITFSFDGGSGYVWRVNGTLTGNAIELRYPAPCDGNTTERFEPR